MESYGREKKNPIVYGINTSQRRRSFLEMMFFMVRVYTESLPVRFFFRTRFFFVGQSEFSDLAFVFYFPKKKGGENIIPS